MPPKDNKEKAQPSEVQQQQPTAAAAATEETKSKKPAGAPKRQKIVKACKDCRRRKVCISIPPTTTPWMIVNNIHDTGQM